MLRSRLCDYRYAYGLLSWTIKIIGGPDDAIAANERANERY